jgi:RNA polymerase sigma factor (TIGR02999 family)
MSDGDRPAADDITGLLHAHREGDLAAFDLLMQRVYDDLKRIARGQLRGHRATLDSTELVHESWFKLADAERAAWKNRGHFFAIAARAMRQVLIDRARVRTAQKRGADDPPQTFDEQAEASPRQQPRLDALLALDQALVRLEAVDPRLVRVVECRFFAGLTTSETAEALDVTERTVGRDWVKARALLRTLLGSHADHLRAAPD